MRGLGSEASNSRYVSNHSGDIPLVDRSDGRRGAGVISFLNQITRLTIPILRLGPFWTCNGAEIPPKCWLIHTSSAEYSSFEV